MSVLRKSPSLFIPREIIQSLYNNTMSLRVPYYNKTLEDMDITATFKEMSFIDIYKVFVYGFVSIVTLSVLAIIYNNIRFNLIKDEIIIPNLSKLINSNYSKKAKESPFISYKQAPLPECPVLEGVEKGQNLVVKYRIPRQHIEKDSIQETNITIMVHDN
jgi:hypothetical protein